MAYNPVSNIGSTLMMKTSAAGTYAELEGVSNVPDLFGDPAEIDVTSVKDSRKRTIPGVEDISALDFEFYWDNSNANSSYRKLRAIEDADTQAWFKLTYPDNTTFEFTAKVYTKPMGFTSGDALKFVAKLYITSDDITITDAGQANYAITFAVKATGSTAVAGAEVEIFGLGTKITDEDGECEFRLENGAYDYKVSKSGATTKYGSFTVASAAQTVQVTSFD